jgi:ribosomal-protein-alanine N-acetyltransferase
MSVVVVPMTDADVAAAVAIDRASFPAGDVERAGDAGREERLREELVRPWSRTRIARGSGGEVLGYVLFWHVADEIHLLNVAVHPEHRRRRIGRALVEAVGAYAEAERAAKILLEVRTSNAAAIALYEGLGFTRFNVRLRYYPDGEDAIEMMLAPGETPLFPLR